ncbi:MAG: hypothetical protein A2430_02205 [Candidatus Liptonbacteria bacterium RIFOXYC1_FULL_36_8]|uniref:HIT domain-containing protein n=2 Tax=Candidatus Liptoniibacteriota TaxID=1817909 RepID=A0A1G2CRE9_9BACT|nr:MAG: hypothetical protein A2430_02205 [Candidatus Liptonbacteria bacterium RIFOXYC1_FULL_36_8]OGZ04371.1 MAG: hypothetical protein A2604_01700 [Candidatus Liptonbacteria bacterium RIFOXYD1_FULL_36_11]
MESCLFCKIANKEIKADVVYEDEAAMAVLDIHPRSLGHIFIIPKKHAGSLLDLEEAQIAPVFSAVKKTAVLIKEKTGADGLSIGINTGRAGGQDVDHLHIHIIPRFLNDGGGSIQSVVNNIPSEEEREKIRDILAKK